MTKPIITPVTSPIQLPLIAANSTEANLIQTINEAVPVVSSTQAIPKYKSASGFELRDFQQKSIDLVEKGDAVLVTAPTGAGKTVIAYAGMMKALREGREFIYTAPLIAINEQKLEEFKAEIVKQILSDKESWKNQVFKDIDLNNEPKVTAAAEAFAKKSAGLITGERKINPQAQVKIMTTEVYNLMSQDEYYNPGTSNSLKKDRTVVFDEGHYLGDPDRGWVWEQSIMHSPASSQIIILSATIGNSQKIVDWVNGTVYKETKASKGSPQIKMQLVEVPQEERPVQLKYFSINKQATEESALELYSFDHALSIFISRIEKNKSSADSDDEIRFEPITTKRKLKETKLDKQLMGLTKILKQEDMLPVIFFRFNRAGCDQTAIDIANRNLNLVTKTESGLIQDAINKAKAENPFLELENEYIQLLLRGVAPHHAEHLPEFKKLVEELFQQKLIKVVCATTTLAAGINMPARTVVIPDYEDFTVSQIKQMSGRAGRAGFDTKGNVVFICDPGKDLEIERKYINAQAEDIQSTLSPNYQTLFTMLSNLHTVKGKDLDEKIDRLLKGYCGKSLLQFQNKTDAATDKVEKLKTNYKAMIDILKKLKYINEEGQFTTKGNIAKEIKFNNPLFITEFIFKLNALMADKQSPVRLNDFTALISLFAQDKSQFKKEKFQEFMEKISKSRSQIPQPGALESMAIQPLLQLFIDTYGELVRIHNSAELVNNLPQIDYKNFFAVANWTNIGQRSRLFSEVDQVREVMRKHSAGKVLTGLKRTSKSLEYLAKAQDRNENFPALIKRYLEQCLGTKERDYNDAIFRRGILAS